MHSYLLMLQACVWLWQKLASTNFLATCQWKWLPYLSLGLLLYGLVQRWLIISDRSFSFHLLNCFLMLKLSEMCPIFGISEVKYFHFIFRKQIYADALMLVHLLMFISFVSIKKENKIMTAGKWEWGALGFICYGENIKVRNVITFELGTVLKYTELYHVSY